MKALRRLSFSLVRDGHSRADSSCVEDTSIAQTAARRMNSYEDGQTTNVADQFGPSDSDVETRPLGDTFLALALPICAKTEQGKLHDILQSFTRRRNGKAERRYSLRLPLAPPGATESPFINAANKENREPTAPGYITTGPSCSRCSRLNSTDSTTSWLNSKDGDSHSLSSSSGSSLGSADTIALCPTPRDASAVHYQHRNAPTRKSKGGFRRLRMPERSDGTAKWTERFKNRKTSRKDRTVLDGPARDTYQT